MCAPCRGWLTTAPPPDATAEKGLYVGSPSLRSSRAPQSTWTSTSTNRHVGSTTGEVHFCSGARCSSCWGPRRCRSRNLSRPDSDFDRAGLELVILLPDRNVGLAIEATEHICHGLRGGSHIFRSKPNPERRRFLRVPKCHHCVYPLYAPPGLFEHLGKLLSECEPIPIRIGHHKK